MFKLSFYSLIFTIIFSFYTTFAMACSCAMPQTPAKAFEQSKAVFLADVQKTNQDANKPKTKIVLNVEKIWKGTPDKTFVIDLPRHNCAYWNFEEGQKYLIYAHTSWDKKRPDDYEVTICSRTKQAKGASLEMQYLDAAMNGEEIAPLNTALFTKATDPAADIRAEAIKLILEMVGKPEKSKEIYETLLKSLSDKDDTVLLQAIRGFNTYHKTNKKEVITALIPLLQSENRKIRMATVHVLQNIGKKNRDVFNALLTAAKTEPDTDKEEHQYLLSSLVSAVSKTAETAEQKKEAFDMMIATLDRLDKYALVNVIQHIGFMGHDGAAAAPKFIDILKNTEHNHVRQYTILSLGNIKSAEAVPAVTPFITHKNCYVSASVTEALYKIDTAESKTALNTHALPHMAKNFEKCTYEYTNILAQIKDSAEPLLPVLEKHQDNQALQQYVRDRIKAVIKNINGSKTP